MVRGPKKHLKRLNAPKSWMLDKLTGVFAPKPAPGASSMFRFFSLFFFLRVKNVWEEERGEVVRWMRARRNDWIKYSKSVSIIIRLLHRAHRSAFASCDLLYAEPHFALRRKKNLCADGDFCVVKKAGKEMDGAWEMRLKRADLRDDAFLSLECRASKRWSRSEDCSRRDCRLRSSRAVFRTSLFSSLFSRANFSFDSL